MNVSYRWLCELVPGLKAPPQEIADQLAMLGAPVDEVVDVGTPLRDVVIARVEEAGQHPNADRLRLCAVDAGGEVVQVVCGATNVQAGRYYPFAPVGATLPGGVTIRKARIRGAESQGMLCSARELGLGRDHEGILELHGAFEPGAPFVDAVGLDDFRLAVDVTPNRPDLLSQLGVAREIAAAYGMQARLHPLPATAVAPRLRLGQRDGTAGIDIEIEDVDLCSRYMGLVVRGVSVGQSPEWLASRLRAIGLRPISNVVDATNFVLHELGQPLHAFDLARLRGGITVRVAHAGERIVTLDGLDRPLTAGMLVIADAERPVAIAGVMGGLDTEVQDETRDILLECAHFDPRSVRATRRALNLSTDASYRFERGVDPDGMEQALQRVADVIVAVSGGTVEAAVVSVGPGLAELPAIELRPSRLEQVLGTAFDANRVATYLEPLGFSVVAGSGDALSVRAPGHRRFDVTAEIDLVEEVARRHGYDAFSEELGPFRPSSVPEHPLFALEDRLRDLLVGRGLLEAHTAAFAPEAEGEIALMHPLAATESRLRAALLPGLIRRVEYNFARGARSIRLFEIGTTFATGTDSVPVELTRVGIVLTGLRRPQHWTEPESAFDVWDIKSLAAEVGDLLGCDLADGPAPGILDPGLSFRLLARDNGEARGAAGRVAPAHVDAPAWADDVWAIEIALVPAPAAAIRYRPVPQFPAVERDLALLVPDHERADGVARAIRAGGGVLLEAVAPFDVYRGKAVAEGMRSIAFRLRFRAADRTLTDAEVDDIVRRILQRLSNDLGIQQRT
jgi:phenylalanyl-tRNA synthetase beta chain